MLHLIWMKDNNSSSSEDGKELKGIRQRLLECYRLLYFDPIADLEPKDQVNRIAKNLVEYVCLSSKGISLTYFGPLDVLTMPRWLN